MKTFLLSVSALVAFSVSQAQDTITSHFTGGVAIYLANAGGYIAGNNAFGDLAKMQLFDADFGITSGGTISSVLLGVGVKSGTGSIKVSIIEDNADLSLSAQTVLGTTTIDLTDIDTTSENYGFIGSSTFGFYNVTANFTTPISIPANQKFWAMVTLPTEGGEIALFSNNLETDPFTQSIDHVGEIFSDESFEFMSSENSWGSNVLISLAIFPVVNLDASGIGENATISSSVYPNPTNSKLNININEKISSLNVISLDAKIVANSNSKTIDVSNLSTGLYIYEATTVSGKVARGKFNKN
jgi:Secretion system C-terminal sorting domain